MVSIPVPWGMWTGMTGGTHSRCSFGLTVGSGVTCAACTSTEVLGATYVCSEGGTPALVTGRCIGEAARVKAEKAAELECCERSGIMEPMDSRISFSARARGW